MLEIDCFSLEKPDGPYETWPEKAMLLKNGISTGYQIPGYDIERQFKFDEIYFLVTAYDCPFEEQCSFLLLDRDYKVIVRKDLIPWHYNSWNLKSHCYLGKLQFTFTFYSDYSVKITLFPYKKGRFAKRIVIHKPRSKMNKKLRQYFFGFLNSH